LESPSYLKEQGRPVIGIWGENALPSHPCRTVTLTPRTSWNPDRDGIRIRQPRPYLATTPCRLPTLYDPRRRVHLCRRPFPLAGRRGGRRPGREVPPTLEGRGLCECCTARTPAERRGSSEDADTGASGGSRYHRGMWAGLRALNRRTSGRMR
jgi:hypothetical protein